MSAQDYEQLTLFLADSHVSHSVWLVSKKAKGTTVTFCLNCVYAVKAKKKTKYCPDCGAKMDLEESTDA